MNRPRLIPVLLLKNGLLVRSQLFKTHQAIGNPLSTIMRYSNWNIDELVLLDISEGEVQDLRRDDLQISYEGKGLIDLIKQISSVCHMPLSVGGGIRTLEDIQGRLMAGADKCVINSKALEDPTFIKEAAQKFGSQCIVLSVDVLLKDNGDYEVFSEGGQRATGYDPVIWVQLAEEAGAGEILLNSINRDGSGKGYDVALIKSVTSAVSLPVIACGGVGKYEDFSPGIVDGAASAVAAANIFHFFELSYPQAKKACLNVGLPMREVALGSPYFSREPHYKTVEEEDKRRQRNVEIKTTPPASLRWCTRCVYPSISAAPMEFDEHGVCMGCRMSEVKTAIPNEEWQRREKIFVDLMDSYKSPNNSNYDCVIAVSGGKDSYFQTHMIKNVFGLNPLLVTYNGNNWTDVGWRNMLRMKEVFDVDHIVVSPSVNTLKKLNRLAFTIMGDMNWHAHVGITTVPVQLAVQHKVPIVIWGEHGYLDLCGQFSMDDFPEMSYRDRLEHFARGYEWNYMVGREGLSPAQLDPWKYPSDKELFDLDVRGVYLGNYVYWEANDHLKLVQEKYGFEVSDQDFERTYRRMSNLDDMHENGVHDYLKYIKFGYGRCTDHVCKDLRAGLMTREEGIRRVNEMDPIKPKDLKRWLEYTGMHEEEFDRIADTFRDPRVWWKEKGEWKREILEMRSSHV